MPEPNPAAELRRLRGVLGFSQEKMSQALDVRYRTYVRYESGETAKVPATVLLKAQRLAAKGK